MLHMKKFKESDYGSEQSTAYTATIPEADPLTSINLKESKSVGRVDFTESTPKVSTAIVGEKGSAENIPMKSTTEKDVEVEVDVRTDKDNETSHNVFDKSARGETCSLFSCDSPSRTMSRYKDTGAVNGSGSLSKVPGLGRAARRQFAAVLDEFWGHLFDYHGKLTEEANCESINLLLGVELRTDNRNIQALKSPLTRDAVCGSHTSWDSVSHNKEISSPDLSFGLQMGAMGSSTWSQGMYLLNTDTLNSNSTLLDRNAEFCVNYDVAPYSGGKFY